MCAPVAVDSKRTTRTRWQRRICRDDDDVSVSTAITSGAQLIFVPIIHRRNLLIRRQFLTGDPTPRQVHYQRRV